MKAKIILSAVLVCAGAGRGAAETFSIDGSTTTRSLKEQLEQAGDQSGKGANEVFDGSRGKGGLGLAAEAVGGFFRGAARAVAAAPLKGLRIAALPAVKEVLSDKPGKKHSNLDTLEVGPDGEMYRMRKEPHAWWKAWKWFDKTKIIEQAKPADDGALFNKKGEFVGDWETVMKTKADGFKVAADKESGKNTIFTFERKGSGTEIGKDGKYVTTLGGDDLREIKIGKDAKVYARYEKGKDDVIVSIDPATKAQATVAKVPAEYKSWQEWHPERGYYHEHGHYEQDGYYHPHDGRYEEKPGFYHDHGSYDHWHDPVNEWVPGENHWHSENVWVRDFDHWHVTEDAHWDTHTSRTGLTKFEVGADGQVRALFKGQVIDPATQRVVSSDNVQNFATDGRGTLYTVLNNKLSVDNNEPTQPWSGDKPLNVDDHGNVYGADGKLLRRYNVTADPSREGSGPNAA